MAKDNYSEEKTEIKLNRKMRMWHKYKNVCLIGAGALAVVIIGVAVFKGFGTDAKKNAQNAAETSKQVQTTTVAQTTTAAQTTAAEQTTPVQTTEAQTTTAAAKSDVFQVAGKAEAQDMTSADYFSSSVFIGDSIMNGIAYYNFLDSSKVYSDGNNTVSKAEAYISNVVAAAPSKVFIMVGLNDVNYGTKSAQSIAESIISLGSQIKTSLPSANVYILSLLPVTQEFEGKASTNVTQAAIDEVNGILSTSAGISNLGYVDVASSFKNGTGYMDSAYTGNGSNIYNQYYPFLLNGIAGAVK